MKVDFRLAALAVSGLILSSTAAMAADTPAATIKFHGGGVGFIAGVNWGSGTLHYKGRDYPIKVSGFSVGEIGANKYSASGEVYHLTKVSDIDGTYAAGAVGATVGGGAGAMSLKNGAGVVMSVHSTSAGLHLKIGPSGVTVKLK